MSGESSTRASIIRTFEREAEMLVVHQLDLLAQIEAQLRAVHHTMRRIERLRGGKRHVGPELSNGERATTLAGLSGELEDLDQHLLIEHECCGLMQETIKEMQARLAGLKQTAARLEQHSDQREPPNQDGSIGT
jgi:hypothetical protein